MKQCPYCNAQMADDSKFCGKCGKKFPQGNTCPHCGASVGEDDSFCHSCGKSLNEVPNKEPVYDEEEESKRGFKKYLPYIISGIVLLGIAGYYFSNSSTTNTDSQITVDTLAVDSVVTNEVTPITKEKMESILSQLVNDIDDRFALNKVNILFTEGFVKKFDRECKKADKEGYEPPRLWWQFTDSTPQSFYIDKLEMTDRNKAKALVKLSSELYEGNFEVLLNNVNGVWLIDKVVEINTQVNPDFADSNEESDYQESSSNSTPSRTFYSEQIVIGYLANQTFRSSDGLTMRIDGDGRLYVDGDYAGVLSVLRYSSTAALLRYSGGLYGEGKLSVQIVGDKFQLTDPVDGTVYY